jgi:YVTN family beta-propeller protein
VESTFSHGGRYLWVPYYRRSYDINAQDPSAVAIIDTETDSIIRLMDTGPLPKMVATSPDGKLIAITHWGDNTVGIIDINSADPFEWHYTSLAIIDQQLKLNFSITQQIDRDNNSGHCLRGTAFTPDNRYLLVGCMAGTGGIAVVDLQTPQPQYLGRITGMMPNLRHLIIRDGHLYLSINRDGYVQKMPLEQFLEAIPRLSASPNKVITITNWQTCKVGTGARTIETTPDGRFLFVACNNSSALYVVDAQTMTVLTSIPVDSYPVGLDISHDGRYVFTTSQGRGNSGGNCVDIYEITDYKVKREK